MAVTAQKICGLFGSLIMEIWHLKCMLDMRKCREWVVDRSQNMGPNCGDFFRHSWAVRGCWGLNWGVYMVIHGINYALVFIG